MITIADWAADVAFVAVFFAVIYHVAAYRPVIAVGLFFIIFTLIWRIVASSYIDLAGPVYSSQTFRSIGPGTMTTLHITAYLLTFAPFFFFLSDRQILRWNLVKPSPLSLKGWFTLGDLFFVASVLFLLVLYADLARRGVIPYFAKMERFEYTNQAAGPLHRWLIRYGNFVAFWCGVMFAAARLREGRADLRYVGILVALFFYLFLTGNRFSAFYSFGSFFIAPYAAVIAASSVNRSARGPFGWLRETLAPRELRAIGVAFVLGLIVTIGGLYNNLVNVRAGDTEPPIARFVERAFIQPSEIGWVSYERVFLIGEWHPERVFDALFLKPIDPTRNTTIQYLMLETIGEPRTTEHLSRGFQFAGGFPEIFFELFGPYLAWPFLLAAGWITAGITALMLRGIAEGHYATAFWAAYVLYGFQVMYIGGMLNFVMPWTFWVKVAALLLSIAVERKLSRMGISLLPWNLVRRSRLAAILSGGQFRKSVPAE